MASPVASAALKARIRRPSMLKKLCRPEDMLPHFPNGAYIGWSGFTGVGYPKSVLVYQSCHSPIHLLTTSSLTGRHQHSWQTMWRRTPCRGS
jgi:hypothetical protein